MRFRANSTAAHSPDDSVASLSSFIAASVAEFGWLAVNDALDFTRPGFECDAFLGIEAVALIDADNTGPRATDMTEHGLDHLQIDAKSLQSGGDGAAQIVGVPHRNVDKAVELLLACGKVGDRIVAVVGEHKVAGTNPWQLFEDGE